MNADDGAAAGRLPSIMLIQVALLAFFQSKEEREGWRDADGELG